MFVTKDFLSILSLFLDWWNNNIEAIFQLIPLLPCLYVNIAHVMGKWNDNINDALLLFLTEYLCITYFYQVHCDGTSSPAQAYRQRQRQGEKIVRHTFLPSSSDVFPYTKDHVNSIITKV